MSDYINEVFKRMNLHKIRSFFLHGTDNFIEEVQPYCDKLKQKAVTPFINGLTAFMQTKLNETKPLPTSPKPSPLTTL